MNAKARVLSLVGTGAIAGGILAGTLSANAATSDTGAATSSSAAPSSSSSAPSAPANNVSSTPVRSDEKAVDSTLATSLTQKAEAQTGGTVYRVETDGDGAAYEAHVKKSDGTLVTVKFDRSGNVTGVEDGMGAGGPRAQGGANG